MSAENNEIHIRKANSSDALALTNLAIQTFLESHSHSASEKDIERYVNNHLNEEILKIELDQMENIFHLIFLKDKLVGYSKIIKNFPYKSFEGNRHTKMERLYLLEETLGSGLGQILFDFNLDLIKKADQNSIWIYTWVENHRAIRFYEKNAFTIVDKADFKISENHSNPNHIMQLTV